MSGQHREGFEWESEPCPGVPVHHHTVGGQRDVPWRFLLLSDPCWYNATLKNVKGAITGLRRNLFDAPRADVLVV